MNINKDQVIRVANKVTCTLPQPLESEWHTFTLFGKKVSNTQPFKRDLDKAVPNAMQEAFIKAVLH